MKNNLPLKIVVSVMGLLAAIVHVSRPDLRIDSVTIILLVIAVIPWAQPLIKSIELLGVKLELQQLQEKVAEAKGAAESATRQVGLALAVSGNEPQPAVLLDSQAIENEIKQLADEYNHIRDSLPSGNARTRAMTNVVSKMIGIARRTPSFDLESALGSQKRGLRLFGYAFLYERPDAAFLLPLVESVTRVEDKPFGQYWGLQALKRVLPNAPLEMQREAKTRLRVFSERIPAGTDRDYELRQILR
jgi:hypothetical protein